MKAPTVGRGDTVGLRMRLRLPHAGSTFKVVILVSRRVFIVYPYAKQWKESIVAKDEGPGTLGATVSVCDLLATSSWCIARSQHISREVYHITC